MNERISIHITTKDRPGELGILLQSLRTQYFPHWDLVILDESEQPIENIYFIRNLLNRIKLEDHYVNIIRNTERFGVCHARQKLINEDYFNNQYICRLDDDVVIEEDYLDSLIDVIDVGYDIASGVTPLIGHPEIERNNTIIPSMKIINKKEIDKEGNLILNKDECGYSYLCKEIIPTHEFRSCALFRKEVFDKIKYPDNLSPVGFREEGFLSLMAKEAGFKIGVDTSAIAYHFASPSGGCRFPNYGDMVRSDDAYFRKWIKEKFQKGELKWLLNTGKKKTK